MSSWSPKCNLSFVQTYSNVLCIDGFKFKEGCICVNRNLLGIFLDYFPKIFKLTNEFIATFGHFLPYCGRFLARI